MQLTLIRLLVVALAALMGWTLSADILPPALGALGSAAVASLAVVLEHRLRNVPTREVLGGFIGAIGGLSIALVAGLSVLPWITASGGRPTPLVPALLALACGYFGAVIGARRGAKVHASNVRTAIKGVALPVRGVTPKVMDTSVIIDGRIADVIASGFIEGPLVVPQFVLRELQQVADSSDPLKRNRGRKGLDVLRGIQEAEKIKVEVSDRDYSDIREVDGKLLALSEELGGKILTNDYNLNKVAQLRGVQVLNVNDLANAMKPVVLPGEMLSVQIIKEGKERNQGVGYLDDGTMVVVDNGKRLIGLKVDVVVTSVIQTNAGKMIFGATEEDQEQGPRPKVIRREAPAATTQAGQG
jgi:uncharacterized protein YacL